MQNILDPVIATLTNLTSFILGMARNFEKRFTGLNRFLEAKHKEGTLMKVFIHVLQSYFAQNRKVKLSKDLHWYAFPGFVECLG